MSSDTSTPDAAVRKAAVPDYSGVHRMKGLVAPPVLSPAFAMEHSIHKPPRMLRRDIELVFRPDIAEAHQREASEGETVDEYLAQRLLAVPTWQPATQDLSEISFKVNEERRGLLTNFHAWVNAVRSRLEGFWSDASDPMEGTALFGERTSVIYNELDGLTSLLRYDSIPIGCCGIVLHPKWQRRAYPVTFFTTAPLEALQAALRGADEERAAAAPAVPQAAPGQVPGATDAEAGATDSAPVLHADCIAAVLHHLPLAERASAARVSTRWRDGSGEALGGATRLDLRAHASALTDARLARLLARCPRALDLNLYACSRLTDDALAAIASHCEHLVSCNLSCVTGIGADALERMCGRLKALQSLELGGCRIGEVDLVRRFGRFLELGEEDGLDQVQG